METGFRENIIMLADSYKYSQAVGQYPKDLAGMHAHAIARSGKVWGSTFFFGLQYLTIRY